MNRSLLLLRAFLAMICAFHVIVGLGLNVWPEFPKLMAGYYGAADFEWSPQFVYILRPLGAFMFALGVLAAFAMLNPLKYGAVCYGFSILFFLRAVQRIVFQAEIETAFGIAPARNYINAAFFLAMAIALVGLYFYAGIAARRKRAK